MRIYFTLIQTNRNLTSDVFIADREHSVSKLRKNYIKTANEGRVKNGLDELTDDEEDLVEENIKDLLNLGIYSLPTLKINANAEEEDVADIFVRVSSGGQNLTEKNFIETFIAARAIYDDAPFIVLDEPAAALDPISEHVICTKFNGMHLYSRNRSAT